MPQQKIQKPWGFEIKLSEEDLPYVCKIAFTIAGKRWSLQYHDQKTETFSLLSGQMKLTMGPDKDHLTTIDMVPSTGYTIIPGTIHRLEAITDCVTVEASTPEIGTTFRLEDDYQRSNETDEIRNSPNRGWSPS
jgi:mannose-6-phosphate isomerase-like protein (cupin superfamily)